MEHPVGSGFPGVLNPADILAEVRDGHEVDVAITVDVQRKGREVVVVGSHPRHIPDVVRLPVGRLVPRVAADDVELAVVVDVAYARGLELALAIDGVLFPLRLAGLSG